ncbi:hypothetical protein ILUMI_11540 [Ignelater luminosus]|uniref:Uncharacterized protein n=1 Tax=Ignelater luminosus TaxID=2038154 RepID=A0A8K0GAE8_IGNLU|nr:hypothetical protein ILUMI_11540 [Ignelater luminosus]
MLGNLFGVHEFLPHTEILGIVGEVLCGDESIIQPLCSNALFAVCGFNRKQMNDTLIPVIMGHTPAGASTQQILHYGQEIKSRRFRQWDYGSIGNLRKYGSLSPPKYKLKNIKAPVYLHYSRNDWLSHERDVDQLAKELGNLAGKFLSIDKKFNHVDYLFGIDARDQLYNRVIGLMKRH